MKLIELAEQHNLDQEILREVVEEDLNISLSKGMDTPMKQAQVDLILSQNGLETVEGEEFKPILSQAAQEKQKRSQAAKKAAATRKRKEEEALKKKEEERRKHEEALAKRQAEEAAAAKVREEEERQAEEAQAARQMAVAALAESKDISLTDIGSRLADLQREQVETGAVPLGTAEAEAKAKAAAAEAEAAAEATAAAEAEAVAAAEKAAAEAAAAAKEAGDALLPPVVGLSPIAAAAAAAAKAAAAAQAEGASAQSAQKADEPPAPAKTAKKKSPADPVEQPAKTAPAAEAPAPAQETPEPEKKGGKKLGSKLASLAKATAEKSDHSTKDTSDKEALAHKPKVVTAPEAVDAETAELSAEDRRRIIQDNIRRNLEMQQRVRDAKTTQRGRRGFKSIDRSKQGGARAPGPGGPGGPGRGGPGGPGGGGPGGPGRSGAGPRRDRRSHRAERSEEEGSVGGRRRKLLSTDTEDLGGVEEFTVTFPCSVRDFSEASGLKTANIIAKLFMAGVVANINTNLDKDTIELLAQEFKKTVTIKEEADVEDEIEALHTDDNPDEMGPRPPVVTVLGHVDHGKTSLLDAIRSTNVTEGEAGGITQHIGAYTVSTEGGQEVTFIDTPGHEAFTEMRARGAQATDIAVIVVAADDGLMPQTIEAINHAKAAEVPIVVAMNKIDKEGADEEKVLRQLSEQELLPEDWGGDIAVLRTSAITRQGVPELLERLALESEVLELQANHFAKASGIVLEANLSEGRGVTSTLLVQRGSLAIGDIILAGPGYGRVRAMVDWQGNNVQVAGPSHAVEISGLSELPGAGDKFHSVENLKLAQEAAEKRALTLREKDLAARNSPTTLASLFSDIEESQKKELRMILKADAAGSLEVLRAQLNDLSTDEVKVSIIHSGVGAVTAGDVTLAEASKAVVIGFHVIAESKARRTADDKGIEISSYTVIYELLDTVKQALSGLLDPETVEKVVGHAEVRATFKSSKVGTIAGLYVTDGVMQRNAYMRLTRDGVILHEGKVKTLKRFKEDVNEVREGYECGMTFEKWNDVQESDLLELYVKEKLARVL